MDVSVIIPAYNEELLIASTIQTIKKWMPASIFYEIILVDHGSTDKTVALALHYGAIIIDGREAKTIAALRNIGASRADGEILLFIDADISLSERWSLNIAHVLEFIKRNPKYICGAHPVSPEGTNVLIRNWFDPKVKEVQPSYIVASHILIAKKTLEYIGGFSNSQETAEEVELCRRARGYGVEVRAFPDLLVTHMGTPSTLKEFLSSEIWHGRSDWASLSSILSSRAAVSTLVFIAFHVLLVGALLLDLRVFIFLGIAAIIAICTASSFFKFLKHGICFSIINIPMFYLYFFARSFSILDFYVNGDIKKRSRG